MIMKIIDKLLFVILFIPVMIGGCCVVAASFVLYFIKNVFKKK
jgi:hypothetical protein